MDIMKNFNSWLALWEGELNYRLENLMDVAKQKPKNSTSDYFYGRTALRHFKQELKSSRLQKGFKPDKNWDQIAQAAEKVLDAWKKWALANKIKVNEPDLLTPHRFGRV